MQNSFSNVKIYPVDIEHLGFRIALPLITIGGGVLIWLALINPLDDLLAANTGVIGLGWVAAAALGMLLAILIGIVADRLLKRYWPSSRSLVINPDTLMLVDNNRKHPSQQTIHMDRRINPMLWRFLVMRSTPKAQSGWSMLAMQLAQDENEMILYTFISPKRAKVFPMYNLFRVLLNTKDSQNSKLGVRETAEQRRLRKLEQERWENGAELRPEDFLALVDTLSPLIEEWKTRLHDHEPMV
jgi:hypothetical protein